MYKYAIVLFVFLLSACSPTKNRNDSSIRFIETEHDFATLSLNKKVVYVFKFFNSSKVPLIIYGTQTSCGCTVANWSKKPINPQASGKIVVTYNAADSGTFHKEILVFYNGENSPVKLVIKGRVENSSAIRGVK